MTLGGPPPRGATNGTALMRIGDAELVALRVGQRRPVHPGHRAYLLVKHPGAQLDQAGDLSLSVLAAEVDVHPVLPDPLLRHLLEAEGDLLAGRRGKHHELAAVVL